MNWFYSVAGEVSGPVSEEELRKLISLGTLPEETLVCREGKEEWNTATLALGSTTASVLSPTSPPPLPVGTSSPIAASPPPLPTKAKYSQGEAHNQIAPASAHRDGIVDRIRALPVPLKIVGAAAIVISGILNLGLLGIVLNISSSAQSANAQEVSRLAASVQRKFGIELDEETANAYAMGYSAGEKLNRRLEAGELEEIVKSTLADRYDVPPGLEKLMLAGLEDGYNRRPSMLEGINLDSLPSSRAEPSGDLPSFAGRGDLRKVKELATRFNVNGPGSLSCLPLHEACSGGHLEVAKYLLSLGSRISEPDDYGRYPIHHAAQGGNLKIVKLLVERGANLDQKTADPVADKLRMEASSAFRMDPNDGDQPIHVAARYNNLSICRYLIAKGIAHDTKNNQGSTPLMCASKGGWIPANAETIRFFDRLGDGTFEQSARSAVSDSEKANVRTDGLYLYREKRGLNGLTHCLRFREDMTVEFHLFSGLFDIDRIRGIFNKPNGRLIRGPFILNGKNFNSLKITLPNTSRKHVTLQGWAKGEVLEFRSIFPDYDHHKESNGLGSASETYNFYPN